MLKLLRRSDPALFLSAMAVGLATPACSGGADRPRSADTAASATQSDSTATATGAVASSTSTPGTVGSSSKASPAAVQQDTGKTPNVPTKARPRPKPSIDPGRKPRSDSATTAKPIADSSRGAASKSTGATSSDEFLKYDAASNTVTFELIAGPFNFNGFGSGAASLVVPPKANVVLNFINKDGTPHSAEVISGEGPIPNAAGDPAIPRAYTNKALEGLPQEGTDVVRFTVSESGTYRIICGVPGHALSGMWIWLRIDPAVKQPSFLTKS